MPSPRVIAFVALAALYGAVIGGPRFPPETAAAVDPMSREVRAAERALVDGRLAEAQALTATLLERHPDDPLLWWLTATLAQRQGQWARAAAAWADYAARTSSPALACPFIAEAFEASGAYDEALRRYRQCAEADKQNSDRLIDLAAALARQQRLDEARSVYRQASGIDPNNARAAWAAANAPGGTAP